MLAWLVTALLTGLISSLHCVGMCGPLAAALPVGRLERSKRGLAIGLYHAGRIATYSTLGAFAGTLGFGLHLLGWQRPLAVFSGIVLLAGSIGRSHWAAGLRWPWLNRWVTTAFGQRLRQPGWVGFAGLGVLNGLLPCGFTYVALAGTLTTDTPLAGATYMLLFGMGTLPALVGVNTLAVWLTTVGRRRLNWALSLATVVVGLLLIGRGLANYQIPDQPSGTIPICHGALVK
ncbi:sulfite exporter TauE/SafE family protein [Spirosoma humi]